MAQLLFFSKIHMDNDRIKDGNKGKEKWTKQWQKTRTATNETFTSKPQKENLFVHIVSHFHLASLAGSPAHHQLEERKLQYHIFVGVGFYCFATTIRQVLTQLMRHNY